MRAARATLFWFAIALAVLALCAGGWGLWLTDDPMLLAVGLVVPALAEMTRRWSKPGRPPRRYDDVPVFLAVILFIPVVAFFAFLAWGVVSVILMQIGVFLGFGRLGDLGYTAPVFALVVTGAFLFLAVRHVRRRDRPAAQTAAGESLDA